MHRLTVTHQHYELIRQFMIDSGLPHARAAAERMIEIAAAAKKESK